MTFKTAPQLLRLHSTVPLLGFVNEIAAISVVSGRNISNVAKFSKSE